MLVAPTTIRAFAISPAALAISLVIGTGSTIANQQPPSDKHRHSVTPRAGAHVLTPGTASNLNSQPVTLNDWQSPPSPSFNSRSNGATIVNEASAIPTGTIDTGNIDVGKIEASDMAADKRIKLRKPSWKTSIGESPDDSRPTDRRVPGSASSLWTTFGTLSLMVIGILIVARLAKRKGSQGSQSIPTEAMEVLGRRTVDPKNGIMLVRCGARILVLSTSEDGLRTLSEITDPLEIDYLAGMCRSAQSESGSTISFQSLFRKQSGTGTPSETQASRATSDPDNDTLKNRLQQMLGGARGGNA